MRPKSTNAKQKQKQQQQQKKSPKEGSGLFFAAVV